MGGNILVWARNRRSELVRKRIEQILPKYKEKPEGIFGRGRKFVVEVVSGIAIQRRVEEGMQKLLRTNMKYNPDLIAAVTIKIIGDVGNGKSIIPAVASEVLKVSMIENALTNGIPRDFSIVEQALRGEKLDVKNPEFLPHRAKLKPGSKVEQLYEDVSKVKADAPVVSDAIFASEHIQNTGLIN